MQSYSPAFLRTIATDVFAAIGTPAEEAAIVAEHLVASNLVGLDSHGVVRIPQYANWVRAVTIWPGGRISVVKEEAATAMLDCGYNFGQVGGHRAMEVAIAKAKEHKVLVFWPLIAAMLGV